MENGSQSLFDRINEKMNELVQKVDNLSNENQSLREEVVTLKAQEEGKNEYIRKLEEDLGIKNMEFEEILKRIEAVLGR